MSGVKSGRQLLLIASALGCLAWTDIPRDQVVAGNRAFHAGEFAEAIDAYGKGLVNHPDSPLLNFNMGTANYKAGKYTQAISSFSRVQPQATDLKRTAETAYNAGNAQYKLGAHAEEHNPQAAVTAYTNALASYRRALSADPADQDSKFNYEFVTKRLEELQEKLQNQDQQKEQQQSQQSQGQQRKQQEHDSGQDESTQQQNEQQPTGQEEESAESSQPEQEGQTSQTRKDQQNDMSSDEARSVIDTARNEELSPEEFAQQAQRGTVTEAVRDW